MYDCVCRSLLRRKFESKKIVFCSFTRLRRPRAAQVSATYRHQAYKERARLLWYAYAKEHIILKATEGYCQSPGPRLYRFRHGHLQQSPHENLCRRKECFAPPSVHRATVSFSANISFDTTPPSRCDIPFRIVKHQQIATLRLEAFCSNASTRQ